MEGSGGYTKECKVRTTTSTPPPPRQSTSYSLLAALSPLLSSFVAYLHNRVSYTPPLLLLPYRSFCMPEVTTHYHTRRHCASSSLNCFPVSLRRERDGHPNGTFLPRSLVEVQERRRRVLSLFARVSRKHEAEG